MVEGAWYDRCYIQGYGVEDVEALPRVLRAVRQGEDGQPKVNRFETRAPPSTPWCQIAM